MLRVWASTQAPLTIRNGLAHMFGLPEFNVEVIAPDIGGGFGTKIMLFYPEEILVPFAAMRLGRPVKWTEDRREHLIAANQERGQIHHVEVAVDAEARILALRDRFLHDTGAYTPYGIVVPIVTAAQLPGPYRLRNYHVEFEVVYTNTVSVSPYRGAGRPHGAFVMERVMGLIAREFGLEPAEVRRRNLIQPHEFPWDVGLTFQDGSPTRYDSGDYPAGLEMALDMIGLPAFRAHQAEARREGRHLGLGLACYVEGTGIGPYEGAHVRVEPSGRVFVATGLTTQGQGHYTTFAQIAASTLGCDPSRVTVVTGDTRKFNWGAGTFASRALVTSGNAIHAAAHEGAGQGSPVGSEPARGLAPRPRARGWMGTRQGRAGQSADLGRTRHCGQSHPLRLRPGGLPRPRSAWSRRAGPPSWPPTRSPASRPLDISRLRSPPSPAAATHASWKWTWRRVSSSSCATSFSTIAASW